MSKDENENVKPYLRRVKNWKVRNMVMLYLEARDNFKKCNSLFKRGSFLSFEKLRDLCDLLFEAKEAHHFIYKRLIDPKKHKFEKIDKFEPDEIELDFMNNIGLLFHKMMVARELKYVMEYYKEESGTFQKNNESLRTHLSLIDSLFDDGVEIVRSLILRDTDNMLLLTFLLENAETTKRHFGKNAVQIVEQFGHGKQLDEIYYSVGTYYMHCGRLDKARKMFKLALRRNQRHKLAQQQLQVIG